MKICVLGVGRSGTKAIYTLLQSILADHNLNADFIYEPFLWDMQTFNGPFSVVKDCFGTMNAISYEGIYNHLKLPLFIENPEPYVCNEYIRELLLPEKKQKTILAKFIRANGRIRLLKAICPEMKIIYIVRNPLDNIHSILNRFSFFGGEFHRDDFNRFISECESIYGKNSECLESSPIVLKELIFWYFMNLFALETLNGYATDSLVLTHESYILHPEDNIRKICSFLQFPFHDKYLTFQKEKIGVVNTEYKIARSEYDHCYKYLELYFEMLDKYKIDHNFDSDWITTKYLPITGYPERERLFYGYTPLRIVRQFKSNG